MSKQLKHVIMVVVSLLNQGEFVPLDLVRHKRWCLFKTVVPEKAGRNLRFKGEFSNFKGPRPKGGSCLKE